jgi:integrase
MITDKQIKALQAREKPYRVFDNSADVGFGVQVTTHTKVFFIQYKSPITDNRRFMKLGKYPDTSLKLARDHCRVARQLIDDGLDPQIEREKVCQQEKEIMDAARIQSEIDNATGTVTQLFEYYVSYLNDEGKRAYKDVEQLFERDIKQSIGYLKARDVKPAQIRDIIRAVHKRGAKIQANHTRTYLMAAYSFGIRFDNDVIHDNKTLFRLDYNPVRDIPVPARSKPGERNLSADEIYDLWHKLDTSGMSLSAKTCIKLLFATGGQRVEEVLHMRWDELDFNRQLWELSSSRTKNSKPHVVPLSDLAISLIRDMKQSKSEYVFPHKDDNELLMPSHTISKAVNRFCVPRKNKQGDIINSGFTKFIPKDIRRTVKSRMGEIGISKEIRDRLHNHALHDVSSKHYDRFDYLQPKKDAMKIWNDWLVIIINGEKPESNIIDITTRFKSTTS